jgi:hypothetical protein
MTASKRPIEGVRAAILERAVVFARRAGRLVPRVYFDADSDYRHTVLLVGSGRSGTSWVPEVINHDHRYRYLYEPFHSKHVPIARHWLPRQYLRPDDADPRYLDVAARILSGRIRNAYADAYNKCVLAHQRLVKDTRLQLALGWIRHHFPGMPMIYLMRHPCAVVNSRMQLGRDCDLERQFFSQPALMADHLEPFRAPMERAVDDFERHVYIWCVENYVPMRQLRAGDAHLIFYEDVCTAAERELEKLMTYLGSAFDRRALRSVEKPSVQARKYHAGGTSAIVTGANLVEAWRKYVPPERVKRAVEIVASFGLDRIYGEDVMPKAGAAAAMFAAD